MPDSLEAPDTLEAWLAYIEKLHYRPVDLGLDRVRAVAERMGLELPGTRIVVGGTNGKGSTCAMLDAILRAAGYRVGRYGSPHLLRFNERAQIDGEAAGDEALIAQFDAVERARGPITLTYFEFTTLAVLSWFARESIDVAILEIGLGGRLDAVNIVDADCSIVTTVDLDHTELLGSTREQIGAEKAHVFRAGRPAICVDPDPPESLLDHARRIGARLWRLGKEFSIELPPDAQPPRQWTYRGYRVDRAALPWPALRGAHQLRNAAGALAALEALAERLPVDQQAVRLGLSTVRLPGRFQVIPGRPAIILDVAHNAHAARALAQALESHGGAATASATRKDRRMTTGKTHAVFGMLRDKDARAVVEELSGVIDQWHLVPTGGDRGQGARALAESAFDPIYEGVCTLHDSVGDALAAFAGSRSSAAGKANTDDRIVVFGSFVIVADALRWLERTSR